MADGDGIQFTVKEMLAQIDAKIDKLSTQLSNKATVADVVEIRQSLSHLDSKVVKRDGPIAAQITQMAGRITDAERELDRRQVLVEEIPNKADQEDLITLAKKLDEITRTVQVRLLTFAFAVALSAVGVALTIVLTSKGGK